MGSGLVVPDISGNDNHGTMTNMDAATDWVQGRHGGEGALEFDGVDDYINVGDIEGLTTGLTISAWVNTRSVIDGQDGAILTKAAAAAIADPYQLWGLTKLGANGATGQLQISISTGVPGSRKVVATAGALVPGVWTHVCGVYDGAQLRVYFNGAQDPITTAANLTIGSNDIPARIGWSGWPPGRYAGYWNGSIGTVLLYSRALSAEEIAHLYAEPYAPIWTPGERKWWWMGAAGGAYYYDHITKRIRGLI